MNQSISMEPNTSEDDKDSQEQIPLKKSLQLHSLKAAHGPLVDRAHKTFQALIFRSEYILSPETYQLALTQQALSIAAFKAPANSFRIMKEMELSVSATYILDVFGD